MARLLLLAHPDDEFAAFPLLVDGDGRIAQVAWLTDGGWGGQSVERRRRESLDVLGRMGLPPSNLHFLGHDWSIPDGALHRRLPDVVPRLLDRFGMLSRSTEIVVPAWEGGHPDHDACHLAGIALSRHIGGCARQFSLYHGAGLPGPLFRVLAPLERNGPATVIATTLRQRATYVRRCLDYRSQWKSFAGLLPFYAWRMRRGDAFVVQNVDPERTSERPHPGPLLYERRGGPSWEDFAHATTRYRAPFRD